MLISFSVENYMSFRDKATISMVASRQTTFNNRLSRAKGLRILPIAAIYGGNESGKSNLCSALAFAKDIIVKGTPKESEIGVIPFALCKENRESPSNFSFVILGLDEKLYEYSFSVNKEKVLEEKLIRIEPSKEEILFSRMLKEFQIIGNDPNLKLVSENTRPNQLFLTNTVEQNQNIYENVYLWFKDAFKIITPRSLFKFEQMLPFSGSWFQEYQKYLTQLDTGISKLEEEPVDSSQIPNSDNLRWQIELLSDERYIEHDEDGKKVYKKFITSHKCRDGEEVKFRLGQESDGTIRLIDILPAFINEEAQLFETIIIDELDRSLHYLLVRKLLESYLRACTRKSRTQILFTTHDLMLMDQELMRRDEMFLVERDNNGESKLNSISDFKGLRIDKDIRKAYLVGRFGGIPRL